LAKRLVIDTLILTLLLASTVFAAEEQMLGDNPDGSRTPATHLIPMLAEPLPGRQPDQIYPTDNPLQPFSTKATCGACHDYNAVSSGWHFNYIDPNVTPGRIGQAWFFTDPMIATQIPLSYRNWPGTFRPQQLGITPSGFLQIFGRQMPGGGIGEILSQTDNPEEILRLGLTGQLEINCLACHNISDDEDMGSAAGWAIQVLRGNYRWAATASSGFAYVTGMLTGLRDDYDFREPFVSSDTSMKPPTVEYYPEIFKHNDWVFFNVSTAIPKQRCYFCHSNADIHNGQTEQWRVDQDVHLTAGLKCVDCHRNGLNHEIIRGYSGEPSFAEATEGRPCEPNNPLTAVSSCEGCHLGPNAGKPVAGRFTAPTPKHAGLSPVHFEKLTCTACHSGPWPEASTIRTKTARANAIGIAGANKSPDVLPHIVYPVFAKGQDGKIGVFKAVWPAYWGTLAGKTITPLSVETVKPAAEKVITKDALSKVGDWPKLTEDDIAKILALLVSSMRGAQPVYIAGGRLYSLNNSGKLIWAENEAAAPYMWPIAHDVRPSAQSLGVRDCQDCHSTDAPFFFGKVAVDSPVKPVKAGIEMVTFEKLPAVRTKVFAFSLVFKPLLKVIVILSAFIIAAVLLLYGLKALNFFTKYFSGV
jgi:hypothetical protein